MSPAISTPAPLKTPSSPESKAGRETSCPTRTCMDASPAPACWIPTPTSLSAAIPRSVPTSTPRSISVGAYAVDTMASAAQLGSRRRHPLRPFRHRLQLSQSPTTGPSIQPRRWNPTIEPHSSIKPFNRQHLFRYGDSFNPSAETLRSAPATRTSPPEKNRTYEVGTKWDLSSQASFPSRASVFETTKLTRARPTHQSAPRRSRRKSARQRLPGRSHRTHYRSLGTAFQLRLSRWKSSELRNFSRPPSARSSPTSRATPSTCGPPTTARGSLEVGRRREFCRQPHRQLHRSARSYDWSR